MTWSTSMHFCIYICVIYFNYCDHEISLFHLTWQDMLTTTFRWPHLLTSCSQWSNLCSCKRQVHSRFALFFDFFSSKENHATSSNFHCWQQQHSPQSQILRKKAVKNRSFYVRHLMLVTTTANFQMWVGLIKVTFKKKSSTWYQRFYKIPKYGVG